MKITEREFASALRISYPTMTSFMILGFGYGILMHKHGFGPFWSLASGIVIYSGTIQFVSIGMLKNARFVMAALTALLISVRYVFFSISMIHRYRDEGKLKCYLYYALCDESYAVLSRGSDPEGVDLSGYRFLVTFFIQLSWVLGSFLGGWLLSLVKFDATGIEFAMTALFTTVFIHQWLDNKQHIPAILGVAATLLCRLLFRHDLFLIPAMAIIVGGLLLLRGRVENKGEAADD